MESKWNILTPIAIPGRSIAAEYAANTDVRQAVAFVIWDLDPNEGWVKSSKVGERLRRLLNWQSASRRMVGEITKCLGPYNRRKDAQVPLFEARGHSHMLEFRLNDHGWALIADLGFPRSERRGGE